MVAVQSRSKLSACAGLIIALLVIAGAPVAWADGSTPVDGSAAQSNSDTQLGDSSDSASSIRGLPDSGLVQQAVMDAAATVSTPLPPQPTPMAVSGDDRVGCYLNEHEGPEVVSPICVNGDENGVHTVVVWGDSHAWMWLPAFDAIGKESQTRVVQFVKSSCPPADIRLWNPQLRRVYTECDDFRRFVEGQISAMHPDVVVLTGMIKLLVADGSQGSSQDSSQVLEDAWAAGLATTIQDVAPYTSQTIVLGDIPYPTQLPADCLSANSSNTQACDIPRSGSTDELGMRAGVFDDHNLREQQVAEQNGAQYVGVTQWFCTDTVCPAVIGGLKVYRDMYHASPNYTYWLSNALGTTIGLLR